MWLPGWPRRSCLGCFGGRGSISWGLLLQGGVSSAHPPTIPAHVLWGKGTGGCLSPSSSAHRQDQGSSRHCHALGLPSMVFTHSRLLNASVSCQCYPVGASWRKSLSTRGRQSWSLTPRHSVWRPRGEELSFLWKEPRMRVRAEFSITVVCGSSEGSVV